MYKMISCFVKLYGILPNLYSYPHILIKKIILFFSRKKVKFYRFSIFVCVHENLKKN